MNCLRKRVKVTDILETSETTFLYVFFSGHPVYSQEFCSDKVFIMCIFGDNVSSVHRGYITGAKNFTKYQVFINGFIQDKPLLKELI